MYSDFEACWRASESRDARFDGRFFIGVRTTGIYCRPVCPAPSPKRENVRFYPTAAAAESAGLRPCRRCRPETAPGTPEWLGGSVVATRALRLISEGYLDRHTVADLARALCVGERQLRRLFVAHLGAPPHAVARTRRLQVARMLIDQTDLPMAQVAAAAGFASIRRFNAAVRTAFGEAPTELRRASRARTPAQGLVLRLPYRPPLAWEPMLRFLEARATPGVEAVTGSTYSRTVRAGGAAGIVELEHVSDATHLRLHLRLPAVDGLAVVVERARRIFDLGADPLAIGAVLGADPDLAPLLERQPGLRVPGAWEAFELAVRAILGQQVSVRGATTLAGRLVERFGEPLAEPEGPLTHLFPAPAALAEADLGAIGLPGARAEAIGRLAAAVEAGSLSFDAASSPNDLRRRLQELPGVGPWTAEYIAMRALRDPDAFPASDLGLSRALSANGRRATPAEAAGRGVAWRPWRAYAVMYLWAGAGAAESPLEAAA